MGGVPGAEALYQAAQNYQGVSAGAANLSQSLTNASSAAQQAQPALEQTLQATPSSWTGSDADAFVGFMGKFAAADKAIKDHADQANQTVKAAEKKLEQAEHDMAQAFVDMENEYKSDLTNAQQQAKSQNPPGTVDTKAVADKAIAKYQPQIEKAIKDAEDAMQSVNNAMHLGLSGLTSKFSVLPHPDTSVYAPGSTTPVNYSGGGSTYSGGGSGGSGGSGGGSGGGGGGGGAGGYGSSGPPPSTQVPGNVDQWIKQAEQVLESEGIHLTPDDINAIKIIIMHESGGNPHAINLTDSNAQAGHPSKGLMQCIDSTFSANAAKGHNDIYNPVDNICAGVKYAIGRYGSMSNVPGVRAVAGGGSYVGY